MPRSASDPLPRPVVWGIATVVAFVSTLGSSTVMARTLTLFSEIRGTVIQDGKPVPGAEVERSWRWHWKDQTGADTTTTDANGGFALPAVTGSSLLGSLLPHEPVIEQTIVIRIGGRDYQAWSYSKRNYDADGEFPGRALRLRCDLAAEPAYHLVDGKAKLGYRGICALE